MSLDDFGPPMLTLRDGVASYFEAHNVTAKVVLGWKERTKQVNQGPGGANRVVIQPSDDQGNGGTIESPHGPGQRELKNANGDVVGHVRALKTWHQILNVSVWAADANNPQDDEATILATWKLYVWTVRAIYAMSLANLEWGATSWTMDPRELSYGRELRIALVLRQPLPDIPTEIIYPTHVNIIKELNEPQDDE